MVKPTESTPRPEYQKKGMIKLGIGLKLTLTVSLILSIVFAGKAII